MAEKSSARKADRIPPEAGGIQVNVCKNPGCANYGVPARPTVRRGGTGGGNASIASRSDAIHTFRQRLGQHLEWFFIRSQIQLMGPGTAMLAMGGPIGVCDSTEL